MMCEKQGFIPRFYVEEPNDKVDYVIKDTQNYLRHLITDETNLENMLEKAFKQIEEDKSKEEDEEADEASYEEELFSDTERMVTDEDLIEFKEFEEELDSEEE